MKCVGGAAMVVASGWMSSKVFEVGETHGGMAAVGRPDVAAEGIHG